MSPVHLPNPAPRQLRALAVEGVDAGRRMVTLLPRVDALLDAADQLLDRVNALVARIEGTEAAARRVVSEADATHQQLRELVEGQGAAAGRIAAALDTHLDDLTAAVRAGPRFADQFERRLLPLLHTLESVAPDLQELLVTSRALNEIIGAVPGLGRAKKRADEQLEHADAD